MAAVRLCLFTKTFKAVSGNFSNNVVHNHISSFLLSTSVKRKDILCSEFSTSQKFNKKFVSITKSDGSQTTKRLATSPKVLVIDLSNNKKSMLLEDAEKLAKHLKLELVEDKMVGKLPTYRLTKIGEIIKSEGKNKKYKSKAFVIKTSILSHDLQNKINQALKALDKGSYVTIEVQKSTNPETMDVIVKQIVNDLGSIHETFEKNNLKNSVRLNFTPSFKRMKELKEKLKKDGKKEEKEEEDEEELYSEEELEKLIKK